MLTKWTTGVLKLLYIHNLRGTTFTVIDIYYLKQAIQHLIGPSYTINIFRPLFKSKIINSTQMFHVWQPSTRSNQPLTPFYRLTPRPRSTSEIMRTAKISPHQHHKISSKNNHVPSIVHCKCSTFLGIFLSLKFVLFFFAFRFVSLGRIYFVP